MRALVYDGPRTMNVRIVDTPVPEDDEVLIEVAYSGICGSELSGYLGQNSLRKPPLVFGHEFSGIVVATGQRVTKVEVGQRVTGNPLVTCGECRYCKSGRQQLCTGRKLLSAALPGSNAEFVKIPERFTYPIPNDVTFEEAALTEPVACAVRAVEMANPSPSTTVLIMGMGPIGLLILQVLKIHGVTRVMVADMNLYRLEQARAFGAYTVFPKNQDVLQEVRVFTDGRGVDVAFDAVGANITRQQCVRGTANGGTVVFTGLHEAESQLPVNDMIRTEIRTTGSFAYSALNFETALGLITQRRLGFTKGVVTASLEEGVHWFETLIGNTTDVTKVLLAPKKG